MRRPLSPAFLLLSASIACDELKIHFPEDCEGAGCEGEESGPPAGDSGDEPAESGGVETGGPDSAGVETGAELALCEDGVAAVLDELSFTTVQSAIDAAGDGDTVEICPGTWSEALSVPGGATLTLRSRSGSAEDTVLDGGGERRVLYVGSGATLTLEALGFANGAQPNSFRESGYGGAVYARSASLTVTDCVFEDNSAGYGGGAILAGGVLTVTGSRFSGNSSGYEGGGIDYLSVEGVDSSLLVEGCAFEGNQASYEGGGLAIGASAETADALVRSSTFSDDTAGSSGGGIAIGGWKSMTVSIEDCAFTGEYAGYGGGAIGGGSWASSELEIVDSAFARNSAGYEGGALAFGSWAYDIVRVEGSTFEENSADNSGGAVELGSWGSVELWVSDSTFWENTSDQGAAVSLGGWSTDTDATFIRATFEANEASSGGALVAGSRIEEGRIGIWYGVLTENTGSAVVLTEVFDVDVGDTDFGIDDMANTPYDFSSPMGTASGLGAGRSFSCEAGATCSF